MQHFHFRMDGREYTVNVNAEEEIASIFDHAANIMLGIKASAGGASPR